MDTIHALLLGILEGLTEFLPVSSTGHLILASSILGIPQSDAHKSFEIAIQLGAILSVLIMYARTLFQKDIIIKLIIAFIPTGILGLTLYKFIKGLFAPSVVVIMLALGGLAFIVVEYFLKGKEAKYTSLESISYKQALSIGLFQSLAMIPGTSRSGATILGGLLMGISKKTIAEFSFLLAVPTMLVATLYDTYKNIAVFSGADWVSLGVGFISAFIAATLMLHLFLRFISRYSFTPFGVYRIILAGLFWYFVL